MLEKSHKNAYSSYIYLKILICDMKKDFQYGNIQYEHFNSFKSTAKNYSQIKSVYCRNETQSESFGEEAFDYVYLHKQRWTIHSEILLRKYTIKFQEITGTLELCWVDREKKFNIWLSQRYLRSCQLMKTSHFCDMFNQHLFDDGGLNMAIRTIDTIHTLIFAQDLWLWKKKGRAQEKRGEKNILARMSSSNILYDGQGKSKKIVRMNVGSGELYKVNKIKII